MTTRRSRSGREKNAGGRRLASLDKHAQADYKVNYVDVQLGRANGPGFCSEVQNTEFFQTIRGGLIVGLYNQEGYLAEIRL